MSCAEVWGDWWADSAIGLSSYQAKYGEGGVGVVVVEHLLPLSLSGQALHQWHVSATGHVTHSKAATSAGIGSRVIYYSHRLLKSEQWFSGTKWS